MGSPLLFLYISWFSLFSFHACNLFITCHLVSSIRSQPNKEEGSTLAYSGLLSQDLQQILTYVVDSKIMDRTVLSNLSSVFKSQLHFLRHSRICSYSLAWWCRCKGAALWLAWRTQKDPVLQQTEDPVLMMTPLSGDPQHTCYPQCLISLPKSYSSNLYKLTLHLHHSIFVQNIVLDSEDLWSEFWLGSIRRLISAIQRSWAKYTICVV